MSTPQVVPTFSQAFWTQVVQLEGVAYLLTFSYSQVENCYYLSIATPEGVDLANGIKLVPGWPLLKKWATAGLPPGELFVQPAVDPPPGLGQLGGNPYSLVYVPKALFP